MKRDLRKHMNKALENDGKKIKKNKKVASN